MSATLNVPSALNPTKYAYQVISDWSPYWNVRGQNPLSIYLLQYETYGDGLVQHSGAWVPPVSQLTDACLSLTAAIIADPRNELWFSFRRVIEASESDFVPFALTVTYTEGKTRYFSLTERRITSADKRHDRRYLRIEPRHDGSPTSAWHILCDANSHWDWLEKMAVLLKLREIVARTRDHLYAWEDLCSGDFGDGDWHTALPAFVAALTGVLSLDRARRQSDCALHNSVRPVAAAA